MAKDYLAELQARYAAAAAPAAEKDPPPADQSALPDHFAAEPAPADTPAPPATTEPPVPVAPDPPVTEPPVPVTPQTQLPPVAVPAPASPGPTQIAMPSVPAALPPEDPAPTPERDQTTSSTPVEEMAQPTPQPAAGFPDLESEFGAPAGAPGPGPAPPDDGFLAPDPAVPPVEPDPVPEHDPLAPTGLDDFEDGPELIDLPDVLESAGRADGSSAPPNPDPRYVVGPGDSAPARPTSTPKPEVAQKGTPASAAADPAAPAAAVAPPSAPVTQAFEADDDMPSLHPVGSPAPAQRPEAGDFSNADDVDFELEGPRREIEQRIDESAAARRMRRRKRPS